MTESSDQAKASIRTQMRQTLKAMSPEARRSASAAACARLAELECFRHATIIMLYMSLASEVDATPAAIRAFQMRKIVCVPRVNWQRHDMNAIEVTSFDDDCMAADEHGIRTPRDGRLIVPSSIDLIVVPGLAFDTQGNRLGRGGGFYDQFLGRLRRSAISVGLAFDSQVVPEVPVNERDMRVHVLATDRRVSFTRRVRSRR